LAQLTGALGSDLYNERSRARRFAALTLAMGAASLASGLLQLAQGFWVSGLGSLTFVALLLGLLGLLRRGVSVVRLGAGLIFLGSLSATALAVIAGPAGIPSLFWVGLAPVLAQAFSGPRVARAMLVSSLLQVSAALWLISHQVFPVLLHLEGAVGAHIVSLCGAVASLYLLNLTFEREMQASIVELQQMNLALDEARASAERANRAKSDFLATMSHEIRTPMNGVLGMTTVMLGGALPDEVREGLLTIKQSGDTLLAVINDVLDFSKLESGKLTLERVPCDLRAEVAATLALLEDNARARGNTLAATLDASVPAWLVGDPVRLRQVLLNLVSNAVKFTQQGQASVVARAGERLVVEVRDTGLGMSAQTCATLFQPFTQADASTTRRFGGTGLGLAIVRRIVEAMEGTVTVSSEPGRGSTFSVSLPLVPAEAPEARAEELITPATRSLNLLLAEDNPVNQKVASRLLEQLGHRVLVAENGQRALELLQAHEVDVVLMDCHMPVMDGFEATRRLRLGPHHAVPVIALTAASLPEEARQCFEAGMNEVLVKPVRRAELVRALERFS
jgi:signal transduction histidine kinase